MKTEALKVLAMLRVDAELWEKEARLQRRNHGFVDAVVRAKLNEARRLAREQLRLIDALDDAHMGKEAAQAMRDRDNRRRK